MVVKCKWREELSMVCVARCWHSTRRHMDMQTCKHALATMGSRLLKCTTLIFMTVQHALTHWDTCAQFNMSPSCVMHNHCKQPFVFGDPFECDRCVPSVARAAHSDWRCMSCSCAGTNPLAIKEKKTDSAAGRFNLMDMAFEASSFKVMTSESNHCQTSTSPNNTHFVGLKSIRYLRHCSVLAVFTDRMKVSWATGIIKLNIEVQCVCVCVCVFVCVCVWSCVCEDNRRI